MLVLNHVMNWIKSHKLVILLFLVIAYLLFKDNIFNLQYSRNNYSLPPTDSYNYPSSSGISKSLPFVGEKPQSFESAQVATDNRVIIRESNLSLLVEDVRKTGDQIVSFAKNNGGYMVTTSYTKPTESPFGNITIRIPTQKLDQALNYFRSLAIKVTNENLFGTDVTSEYTDIEARLATLQKTKTKFEDILAKASNVQDILTVQRELINIQDQIDSLKGQKQAIKKNAELTKITVYLSTDEIALPYTPDTVFRPDVIFKQAVRSLVNTLRTAGEVIIWIAVYSPLIAFAIVIFVLIKRFRSSKKTS